MRSCFDYSSCSFTSGFPVYLYNMENYFSAGQISVYLKSLIRQTVNRNPHFTMNPRNACLYLVLIEESNHADFAFLKSLPYWKGDGKCLWSLSCPWRNFWVKLSGIVDLKIKPILKINLTLFRVSTEKEVMNQFYEDLWWTKYSDKYYFIVKCK